MRAVERAREALRQFGRRSGARPLVVATDTLRQGGVTTYEWPDRNAPDGRRWQTVARWPDGSLAERRWSDRLVDAQQAHAAVVSRHKRRTILEE